MISCIYNDHMGDDLTVVNAARVSMGCESQEFSTRDSFLLKFLAEENHGSPFKHPVVQCVCKAPIFVARQLGKHQIGFVWNEQSRRYKDNDSIPIECYTPEVVLGRPDNLMKDVAQPINEEVAVHVRELVHVMNKEAISNYLHMLSLGVAPEQARGVLPQNMVVSWMWTGSLLAWFNLYRQRSAPKAQMEVRLFAEQVDAVMSVQFPEAWGALIRANERVERALELLKSQDL